MPRKVTALVPLPLYYNPDRRGRRAPVEEEKFERTVDEISARFGGGTLHRSRLDPPRGFWWDRGTVDRDEHAFFEVDLPDTPKARGRFVAYLRDVLIRRFRQKAIYVKFLAPVTALTVTRVTRRK